MLIQLRTELLTANLSVENLPDSPKNQELKKILSRFEEKLANDYANYSEFGDFTSRLADGEFDFQLKDVTIVIDGYTRFSAEEELFIESIQDRVARFVIGTFSELDAPLTPLSQGRRSLLFHPSMKFTIS